MGKTSFIDLTGQRFGKWTVVSYVRPRWECKCDCGTVRMMKSQTLRVGHSLSCGCLKIDLLYLRAQQRPRAAAQREGRSRYEAPPCKRCGCEERVTSTRACPQCQNEYMARRREQLGDAGRKVATEWRKKWKAKNPGKDTAVAAARRSRLREWIREYGRMYSAKRGKHRETATPEWADREAIAEFYANCPPGFHVDHIVPLRGKIVSGLHVLNNLQYLPPEENKKKANLFDGEESCSAG
jgi:hypothetical protein